MILLRRTGNESVGPFFAPTIRMFRNTNDLGTDEFLMKWPPAAISLTHRFDDH